MTADELKSCCGSSAWVKAMERQPFKSAEDYLKQAHREWLKLSEKDWLEAFSHHPQIGDLKALRVKFAGDEQGRVKAASEATLQKLQLLNQEYLKKFGFIFIVCATGKSADEMLEILKKRIQNSREQELKNAAAEQAKITELRIRKILGKS